MRRCLRSVAVLLQPRASPAVSSQPLRRLRCSAFLSVRPSAPGEDPPPPLPTAPPGSERERALGRALQVVGSRLKSSAEVRKLLTEEEFEEDATAYAVAHLEELRLLDDAAFAATLCRYKWRTAKWGAARVRHALRLRLVPPAVAAVAVEALFGDDGDAGGEAGVEALRVAARRRWALSQGLEFAARERRLAGWVQRRGFDWRVARSLVQQLAAEETARDGD